MKLLTGLFIIIVLVSPSMGLGMKPFERPDSIDLVMEDFDDGNYTKDPEWWVFGGAELNVIGNPAKDKYSLLIRGIARDWYVGGIGLYLGNPAKNYSRYSRVEMDVYGYGPKSGTAKIELYDDDNGNWQVEQDPKTFNPLFDDKFVYELKIDWDGWKHVSIPISEFADLNPEAGDNVWNPSLQGGSGGLLQMQIIAVASSKTGKVEFILDNIGLNGASKL